MRELAVKMPDGRVVLAEVVVHTTTLDVSRILAQHQGEFFSVERRIGSQDFHMTWKQRAS